MSNKSDVCPNQLHKLHHNTDHLTKIFLKLCVAMKINTKVKSNIMEDGCANTSAGSIGNGLVGVSWNEIKSTLVGFYYYLLNKSITNVDAVTDIDLPNFTIIYNLNETPIIHRWANSLLSTSHSH